MPLCFIQIFGSRSVSFTVAVSVAKTPIYWGGLGGVLGVLGWVETCF